MKKKLIAAILALSGSAIAGTVFAQPPRPATPAPAMAGKACLQHNRMDRWSVVNSRTLEVIDKTQTKFRVALNGTCAHSSFVSKLIFERPGASSLECVEVGDLVKLTMRNAPVEQCAVSDVSYYTDAQRRIDEKVDPAKP